MVCPCARTHMQENLFPFSFHYLSVMDKPPPGHVPPCPRGSQTLSPAPKSLQELALDHTATWPPCCPLNEPTVPTFMLHFLPVLIPYVCGLVSTSFSYQVKCHLLTWPSPMAPWHSPLPLPC